MKKEIGIGLVVIAIAAWYYWQCDFLPTKAADPLGPAAYPRLLALAIMFFAVLHIIVSYFRRHRLKEDEDTLQGRARLMGNLRIAGVVVATIAYLILMDPLGYVLSTFIYILAIPLIVGERSVRGIVTSAFVLTAVLYVVFVRVLGVLVPGGIVGQILGQ